MLLSIGLFNLAQHSLRSCFSTNPLIIIDKTMVCSPIYHGGLSPFLCKNDILMKNKPTLLIVDDNQNFIEKMVSILNEFDNINYINVANSYDEAHLSLTDDKPDIVLLDINLPGKNGIELLRKIKLNRWGCEVIMITNHTDIYYKELCTELGASHFLDKSSDFELVPLLINEWIQN